jgi:hypothetical protein
MFGHFEVLGDGDLASISLFVTAFLVGMRRHIFSPRLAFANAWGIRVCGSLFFSFLINAVSETRRSLPLLVTTILLVVFLIESVRLWNLTNIFTKIDVPIFPRFKQCDEKFVWPMGKFFDCARELISDYGFSAGAFLKIGGGDFFVMYSPVFYSRDRHSRLQIIFDAFRIGRPFLNCILTSFTKSGGVIVTNNLHTVFASFYPKSWDVKRCPMASLESLLRLHAIRIEARETTKIDDSSSWESINSEHYRIELVNCESGFCEKLDGNSNITLTFSGRYRLWCDLLKYTYAGCSS